MASISKRPDGRCRVQWYQDGRQCRLALGRVSADAADAARRHIEELAAARAARRPPDPSTREWLDTLPDKRHARIVHFGLAEPRSALRCQWLSGFADWIRTVKAAEVSETSTEVYNKVLHNLLTYFGDCQLSAVSRVGVNEFRAWLLTSGNRRTGGGLSAATVDKRLKTCREWFALAVSHGWIRENPFTHLRGLEHSSAGPESRKVYVERSIIDRMIEHTPDVEWRLILSLWRYAGLRELEPWFLKIGWIDWELGRMRVYAPKQRSPVKQIRTIPIWPQVAPHLRDQIESAPDGTEYVIYRNRYRIDAGRKQAHAAGASIRSRFEKHLAKAVGIPPWPRLIQNLRASGETDAINAGEWSDHTVGVWWNHDIRVQGRHYLTIPDSEYAKAIGTSPDAIAHPPHEHNPS